MTFEQVHTTGQKISTALDVMENILSDPLTIKPQLEQVRGNSVFQMERLRFFTKVVDLSCLDCNHPRMAHDDSGTGHCGMGESVAGVVKHCPCVGWVIEVREFQK